MANSERQDYTEQVIRQETIFNGRMISVQRDTVRLPNGEETQREVVRHPGAVGIVALKGEDVLLVRQYRYPVGAETLEIPAGKLDAGEPPLACAERELREETGYSGKFTLLGSVYTTPGFTDEIMHLFLAEDLVWNPLTPDADEFLHVEPVPWTEALAKASEGGFNDAKTILGLLWVQRRKA